jgi:peptidoglycan/LPS O-acetylase OafA/YrhL
VIKNVFVQDSLQKGGSTGGSKSPGYFENLDGLRFVCFLMVFLYHSFHTEYAYIKQAPVYRFVKGFLVANGNLGVNFFFVLSGFLITYLLLKEKEQIGRIDIVTFWKKRVLRIWPLFFFCVFFGFVIFPQIKLFAGQQPNETADPLYYITFLNNFDFIKKGLPDASILGVLWSVAIEEQFYFVWPLLLWAVPERWYGYCFGAIIMGTLIFRAVFDNATYNEYHTLSCIGDMTVGGLGALWVCRYGGRDKVSRVRKGYLWLLYGLVVFVVLFRMQVLYWYYPVRVIERVVIAGLFLAVILEQNYATHSLFKMSRLKTISNLGLITYGLYCLHFIGILTATQITSRFHLNTSLWQVLVLDTALALGISIAIASLSYRYFEGPFLRLKDKLHGHAVLRR